MKISQTVQDTVTDGLRRANKSKKELAAAQAGRSANLETFGERWQRTMLHGEMVWSPVYARDMANVPRWVGPEVMASRCGALNREVMKAAVETHRSKNPGTVKMTMLRVMAVLGDRERDTGKRPARSFSAD